MLILPSKTRSVWKKFWEENQCLVYKYIVREISSAINEGLTEVELFKVEGSMYSSCVTKDEYVEYLSKALNLFLENEEYEYAEKTKRLIVDYQLDNLVQETPNIED